MLVKHLLKKVLYGHRADSTSYIEKLRSLGAIVGDDVTIHAPRLAEIDLSAPFLLKIGDHVNIAGPTTILTHDYSWSVIKGKWGDLYGNEKPVTIGSNVFIGWGAIILCGTVIEDNVVIGAHSVVSGRIQADSVYGGIPAKRICSLERYKAKREDAQMEEALELFRCYLEHFGSPPPENIFREYFPLFRDPDSLDEDFFSQARLMGNYGLTAQRMCEARRFATFEAFVEECQRRMKK